LLVSKAQALLENLYPCVWKANGAELRAARSRIFQRFDSFSDGLSPSTLLRGPDGLTCRQPEWPHGSQPRGRGGL